MRPFGSLLSLLVLAGLSFIGTRTNNESKSLDVTLRNNIVQSHRFTVKHISGGSGVRQ
ncbi:hypothetical protein ABHV46_05655 [Asaia sp. BMEF1]|uniref:hypothetical protein n=1 Tax=Asaia sp. BMEF1 TaxID=3155932 RepID=UPI003F672FB6